MLRPLTAPPPQTRAGQFFADYAALLTVVLVLGRRRQASHESQPFCGDGRPGAHRWREHAKHGAGHAEEGASPRSNDGSAATPQRPPTAGHDETPREETQG